LIDGIISEEVEGEELIEIFFSLENLGFYLCRYFHIALNSSFISQELYKWEGILKLKYLFLYLFIES
jgi:hypothetical protein